MCGRYTFFMRGRDLEDRVEDDVDEPVSWRDEDLDRYEGSYNVAPSTENPVVRTESPAEIALYNWGLVPRWADDRDEWELINARSETVDEKPAFRDAFDQRRCLVPAQGFFEWQSRDDGTNQPYRVVADDPDDLFYFAGLYERWQPPEEQKGLGAYGGGVGQTDESLWTYTILTEEANEAVADVHSRMPVILQPGEYEPWLKDDAEAARRLLDGHETPCSSLEVYPVSGTVNNPANDSPEVLVESRG